MIGIGKYQESEMKKKIGRQKLKKKWTFGKKIIYTCESFEGGIFSVTFREVAICLHFFPHEV